MSTPPDRPIDALGLARSGAGVEREFEVARFTRLRDRLATPEGRVKARAGFRLEGDWAVADLAVAGDVVLACQRCLGPMPRRIDSEAALVFAGEVADGLPDGYEPVEGDPRKLDLATLVEDELLLSLPVIPQHGAGERCELPDGRVPDEEATEGEMRRPFAGLKDLLKH
jgi:uncharacterized protein